jgi:twinkle protein
MHIRVDEISKRLSDRSEAVCQLLLNGGKRVRNEWLAGDISGVGGESLKVTLTGEHAGHWRDWSAGDELKGDLLDLWRFSRNLSRAEVIREAKSFLGIVDPIDHGGNKSWATPQKNGCRPLDPNGPAIHYLHVDRKLDVPIIHRFKVEGDPAKRAIVFPSYSPKDALINRSYRTLPKGDEKKKVWQDAGCAPSLFGWQAVDEGAYLDRTILLCEGQIDCMTWKQWGVDALSIPNGTGTTWIDYEWDNLAAFDNIYLAFDTDNAGKENAAKVIQRLGKHRCLMVTIDHKDANDALKAGCTATDAGRWLKNAKPPVIKNLIAATDLKDRVKALNQKRPEAFSLPFFRKKWPDEGLYFRDSEVSLWVGDAGDGKSTFLNFLCLGAIAMKKPVFIASMEIKAEKTVSLMGKAVANSGEVQLDEEKAVDMIAPFIHLADLTGYITQESLLEMLWFAFQRHGISVFVIDSLMRIAGLEEDYPAQGMFMNRLQEFAAATNSHIHLVVHPRKIKTGDKVDGNDIKGSSGLRNNASNVILLTRNPKKKSMLMAGEGTPLELDRMHDTEIRVEKQRDSGWVGGFFLKYHHRSGTFSKHEGPVESMAKKKR